ncbi:prepilin-type N-terminal cleavage/methylation domain-containing protein [Nostocaceae cyanobacterium CENA357]|uniref:Prepilin-type N-terminal cleavage/methylation domain-containing protein n=2 Tax=Atlanticothrix TaxID=2840441 RepID=A0A8J7HH45_9CYAN|nr:prepilin-type N-terminal cleavage/methylation domain-containing protein [Atlanticothrix silvestris CENA357]
MSSLKFILNTQLKRSGINNTNSGFTLIELLVAMILAFLVITPLMGFMISMMDSDRKEQAKASTEQEIQAALDYMARDLQQAVYIYDADGLTRNSNTTTISSSGIQDQIPPVKTATNCNDSAVCKPILVFWKREFLPNSIGISANTQTSATLTDDGFAYSLVAYYLITNPNKANPNWSREARIGRFQIRGQVAAATANTTGRGSDPGFNKPPLDKIGATLKEKMNQWQAASANYDQPVVTLVDYVSTTAPGLTVNSSVTATACPGLNPTPKLVGSQTSGFFVCVDAPEVLAQVYLTGNALARVQDNALTYADSKRNYFPSVNIRNQGRGYLFTK